MPYTTPTATELKTRYPAFASVSDTLVDFAITDANRFVDDSWFEDDYQQAIMALASHILVTEGALGDATNTTGLVKSEKLGDASVTYADVTGYSGAAMELATSAYGRAYLRMRQVNVPAVAIL